MLLVCQAERDRVMRFWEWDVVFRIPNCPEINVYVYVCANVNVYMISLPSASDNHIFVFSNVFENSPVLAK